MTDVRWEGLEAWKARLHHLNSILPDTADQVTKTTSLIIAGKARALTPTGPGANGHARSSIKANNGTVVAGGVRYPYFPWLDFGGRVGRNNSVYRTFLRGGRIIFAAYRADKPMLEERMEDSVESAIRRSGLR